MRLFCKTLNMNIIEHLEKFGFAIQENVIPEHECEKMANILDEIEEKQKNSGKLHSTESQTVLFNVHLDRPDIFMDKIDLTKVMDVLSKVFHDEFILSNFNASKSGPKGGDRAHIDSRIPITNFYNTFQVAVLLCLDDFTEKNGATIVWPFSHKSDSDPRNLRDEGKIHGEVTAIAPKVSVVYTLGQTWHDVGPNIDGNRRWGIIAYYARWWVKPTFDFTKCGSKIFSSLNGKQKSLLGFTSRPPTNTDKRHHTVIPIEELPDNYDDVFSL